MTTTFAISIYEVGTFNLSLDYPTGQGVALDFLGFPNIPLAFDPLGVQYAPGLPAFLDGSLLVPGVEEFGLTFDFPAHNVIAQHNIFGACCYRTTNMYGITGVQQVVPEPTTAFLTAAGLTFLIIGICIGRIIRLGRSK